MTLGTKQLGWSKVRTKGLAESRESDARTQARQAAVGPVRQEGQEPETGDRHRTLGGASRRRQGAGARLALEQLAPPRGIELAQRPRIQLAESQRIALAEPQRFQLPQPQLLVARTLVFEPVAIEALERFFLQALVIQSRALQLVQSRALQLVRPRGIPLAQLEPAPFVVAREAPVELSLRGAAVTRWHTYC